MPSAYNYNSDANTHDKSCEYASCIDCLGIFNGVAVIDSCGTCDAVTTNDCVKDCAGEYVSVQSHAAIVEEWKKFT